MPRWKAFKASGRTPVERVILSRALVLDALEMLDGITVIDCDNRELRHWVRVAETGLAGVTGALETALAADVAYTTTRRLRALDALAPHEQERE